MLEAHNYFDSIKLFLVNAALCIFALLGITKLVVEELETLIPKIKRLRATLKERPGEEHAQPRAEEQNDSMRELS